MASLHLPNFGIKVRKPILVKCDSPSSDIHKLNIDGTAKDNLGLAEARGVIRNSKHAVISTFSTSLGVNTNNVVESFAFAYRIENCYQLDMSQLHMETDSLLVVHWFNR